MNLITSFMIFIVFWRFSLQVNFDSGLPISVNGKSVYITVNSRGSNLYYFTNLQDPSTLVLLNAFSLQPV